MSGASVERDKPESPPDVVRPVSALKGMTWERWQSMSPHKREALRDLSGLSPQLVGLEGWRVEVVRLSGEVDRFQVGRSTGWRPCSLELANARSSGGGAADHEYREVRKLRKVR